MVNNTRRRQSGFSMVELMIAMAIIAIALFAAISMIMHTSSEVQALKELEMAREAAIRKVEEMRAMPWTSTSPVGFLEKYLQPYSGSVPAGGHLNVETFSVSTLASDTSTDKKGVGTVLLWGVGTHTSGSPPVTVVTLGDVEVLIEWKGVRGPSRYSLRTMYARNQ